VEVVEVILNLILVGEVASLNLILVGEVASLNLILVGEVANFSIREVEVEECYLREAVEVIFQNYLHYLNNLIPNSKIIDWVAVLSLIGCLINFGMVKTKVDCLDFTDLF
jgi:hypothetical protein